MEKAINDKAYAAGLKFLEGTRARIIGAVVHNKWLVLQLDCGMRLRVRNS